MTPASFSKASNKKDLNFDLNLIPMIDVFSACICFLLMTVVWIHIGMLQVNQSFGAESQTTNPKSLVVSMAPSGLLELSTRNSKNNGEIIRIRGHNNAPDYSKFSEILQGIQARSPEIKTALVMPNANTNYQDILNVMDHLKKKGLKDIGITPL